MYKVVIIINEIDKTYDVLKIIKSVRKAFRHEFESHFQEFDITGTQGMVIGILAHNEEVKVSDLSEKMCLSVSTVSGILDRLEKKNYIIRKRSTTDRRVVMITLNDKFREDLKCKFDSTQGYLADIIKEGSDEDIEKMFEGLEILNKLIEKNNKK